MKTINELQDCCAYNKRLSTEEVHQIARECVWFCSDSMDHFYCVLKVDERTFGMCVMGRDGDKGFEVLIAEAKTSEVAEWVRDDSPSFYAQWSKARAQAIANAVAQSITDGFGLQDDAEVSQGFMKSFCKWL